MSAEDTAESILAKVGVWWPSADEGRLRQAADAWDRFAAALDDAQGMALAAQRQVVAGNSGAAVEAFGSFSGKYTAGSGYLPTTGTAARDLASGLRRYADEVSAAKRRLEELAVTVGATIAVGTALAFFSFGVSEAAAGAATAALVSAAADIGVELSATVAEIAATALTGVAIGAVEGFSLDVAVAQPIRVLGFHDGGFSWNEAETSAVAGGVGGGFGGGLGVGTRTLSSGLVDAESANLARIAAVLSGPAGKALNGVGAAAAADEATTGHLNPLDLVLGGVGGGGASEDIGLDTQFGDYTAREICSTAMNSRLESTSAEPMMGHYRPFAWMSPKAFARRYWDPIANWWRYPFNDGAVSGTERAIELPPGMLIDRFGTTDGKYLSPNGTDFSARALPPSSIDPAGAEFEYHRYEVLKPIPVLEAEVTPWFGQRGGGIQYKLRAMLEQDRVNVEWLLRHDFLREVTPGEPH